MVGALKVFERIVDGGPLETEVAAELLQVELQLASFPGLVRDLVELVQLLVDVLDERQGRE